MLYIFHYVNHIWTWRYKSLIWGLSRLWNSLPLSEHLTEGNKNVRVHYAWTKQQKDGWQGGDGSFILSIIRIGCTWSKLFGSFMFDCIKLHRRIKQICMTLICTEQKSYYPPGNPNASHLLKCPISRSSAPVVSRWWWPGNRIFLEVASMVVIWWILFFCADW